MEKITFKISGMSCDHCKETVNRTIRGFSGVSDVNVNLQNGTASFINNSSLNILENIKAAIIDEGYEIIT
ncbi:MAG: cation transporter [Treponema sp.]|nr:cation transporter [Treponema sp.]